MAVASELFQSRMQVLDLYKPTCVFLYMVSGATDEVDATNAAIAAAPATYGSTFQRQCEILERINDDTWRIAVKYDVQPEDWSPAEIGFDSTGGTAHITQDIAQIGVYPAGAAPDVKGAIGYDGDKVNGIDIVSPVWKYSELHYMSDADEAAGESYWYDATGKVNSDSFRGYAPGELLFEGVTGNKRSPTAPYALTFKFSASPNQTGLVIGSITGIAKKGWEVLDVFYADLIDGTTNARIKVPKYVTVHQVYETVLFSTLGI